MRLISFTELENVASIIPMYDIFSNQSRCVLCTSNNDTFPDIPDNVREILISYLIDSPYYWGTNWYGRQLKGDHPKFIPIQELKKWFIKHLIYDIRIHLLGQWYKSEVVGNTTYRAFLISEAIPFRNELLAEFSKFSNWKDVQYKVLSILDGISLPSIIDKIGI